MAKTLISTHAASASATLDITSGIDSTYPVYEFIFVNMHPATDEGDFRFQVNAYDHASTTQLTGFNETMTSTVFVAYHGEGDATHLGYDPNEASDQAQGTAYQVLVYETGSEGDQACSGILTLYDPSSTTFVKHFTASTNDNHAADYSINPYVAGYINTTNAINQISFKFSGGNIDDGTIYMYGVG